MFPTRVLLIVVALLGCFSAAVAAKQPSGAAVVGADRTDVAVYTLEISIGAGTFNRDLFARTASSYFSHTPTSCSFVFTETGADVDSVHTVTVRYYLAAGTQGVGCEQGMQRFAENKAAGFIAKLKSDNVGTVVSVSVTLPTPPGNPPGNAPPSDGDNNSQYVWIGAGVVGGLVLLLGVGCLVVRSSERRRAADEDGAVGDHLQPLTSEGGANEAGHMHHQHQQAQGAARGHAASVSVAPAREPTQAPAPSSSSPQQQQQQEASAAATAVPVPVTAEAPSTSAAATAETEPAPAATGPEAASAEPAPATSTEEPAAEATDASAAAVSNSAGDPVAEGDEGVVASAAAPEVSTPDATTNATPEA